METPHQGRLPPLAHSEAMDSFGDPSPSGLSGGDVCGACLGEASTEPALTAAPCALPSAVSTSTSLVTVHGSIAGANTASTVGLARRPGLSGFSGHTSAWMNADELKKGLGRKPGPLERPSLLNALAFKCGGKTCTQKQCSLLLQEINVYHLRQQWSIDMCTSGYKPHDASEAVSTTLMFEAGLLMNRLESA